MRTCVGRGFRVNDALVLVAASAFGMATSRAETPFTLTIQRVWETATRPPQAGWSLLFFARFASELGCIALIPTLAAWTLACLLLRFLGPRAPWRRCSRQTGGMACLVASASIGLWASVSLRTRLLGGELNYGIVLWGPLDLMIGPAQTGAAVFWCWTTMALSGRWRSDSDWLERLGRIIGLLWIEVGVVFSYAVFSRFYYL
jgi:hypothetical protein